MYTSREPFLALTDLSWLINHFSNITDNHPKCLCLYLQLSDIWPNLMLITVFHLNQTGRKNLKTTVAAPDLAILLVHTGQSSSLIGQNAEADIVPACLPEMKYREECTLKAGQIQKHS